MAGGLLLSRWLSRRKLQKRLRGARERRAGALRAMEDARDRLADQHPVGEPSAILKLPLADLVQKLADGELTPEAVLHTYMTQALQVTGEVNCITDYLLDCEEQLSTLQAQSKKGPLYGVPISLKDNFNYKGHDSTLGLVRNLERPAEEDCVVVQVLKLQGAIPFLKTNVPQSMLNYDCSNPIFGQTLNPLNHKKTPGGSSGGEGALIAGRGSILGFGSDIGGSIRFPSAFCGLCGLKPTSNRLSKVGVASSNPGQKSVAAMIGPIARDVDSLVIAMRALLCDDMFKLDPTVPPIPFNDKVYSNTGPLRIGYYETDGSTMATPSMRRAVLQTRELLEQAGHQLVPFSPPSMDAALYELALKGLLADGGSTFLENFKGDEVDPNLKTQVNTYAIPSWLKSLLSFIVWPVFPRLAKVLQNVRGLSSVKELWRQNIAVEAYRQELMACWREAGLDALVCPILGPALSIGAPGKLTIAVSYTVLYNLVDFPVGVLPVTAVTKEDEEALKGYTGHHKDFWDKLLKKAVSDGLGLPVAVQCVTLPWQEEKCLRLMKEVERVTQMNPALAESSLGVVIEVHLCAGVGPWSSTDTMLLRIISVLVPEFLVDLFFVSFLLVVIGSILVLRWMGERRSKMKIENAQTQRDSSLEMMEKLTQRYKSRHGDVASGRILALTLEELVRELKSGSLTPEAVLHTYIEKALEVTREVNCVTDYMAGCEAQLQEVKKHPGKGLLYGVPISIKDNVGCKGHNSNCGLVHFLGPLEQEDSVIVQVLKKQGAIPFVKTTVPQSLIIFDCSNSIYGQTVNPLNHKKTCGGSSGGEGALIAGGGSILGVGTDVLGSIRMPSSFCGIPGFKPSGDRLSEWGLLSPVSGMKTAVNMPGPMARNVDSLALFMKAVLCDDLFQLDPTVPPVPFRDEIYKSTKPLTIGFYDMDGYFLPHPSSRRAIQETRSQLEEAGHKLVPFTPPRIEYALNELCIRGFFADGGKTLSEKFNPDIVDSNLKQELFLWRTPAILKKIVAFFLRPVFPRIANHVEAHSGAGSVKGLWKHYTAVKEYRMEFISEWRKLGLDALLCPALGPAFNLGHPGKLFVAFSFTMLFNILNFPAGVLPVTTVTAEDEEELKHYKGYSNDPWDKEVIKGTEGGVGLPVSVQCVALQWQEEQCLRLMKEVETAMRGNLKK
ncbi:fatty-acid amide hydrolase 1 [Gastrophryne carolinensis]